MTRWMPLLLVVALVGWVGAVSAQQTPPQAPAPAMGEKMTEGKVKAVDQAKKQVTLEDGRSFTVPATVAVEWTQIRPGATVTIAYVEAGPQKTVRKLEVKS
jgi:hypothetical protein